MLYHEYSIGSPLAVQTLAQCLTGRMPSTGSSANSRLIGFEKFLHETSQPNGAKTDRGKYLEEPLFHRNVDFSLMNWWKVHTQYSIVPMMTQTVLGIQTSKVHTQFTPVIVVLQVPLLCKHYCAHSQDWIGNELEN